MRIIAGKFKGKKLFPPNNVKIRPTSDRAKEMIFNTLNSYLMYKKQDFNNLIVLDCFCGSGAIGLEFLSRGAKEVIFVDNSLQSLGLTKKNYYSLNTTQKVSFLGVDYRKINFSEPKINFFYLDPPYEKFNIENILFSFLLKNILASDVSGIVELPVHSELNSIEGFKIWEEKTVSKSLFYFIEKKK